MEQARRRQTLEQALVQIPTRTSVPEFLPRPAPEAQRTRPPVLPPFPASTFAAAAQRSSISPASERTAALPLLPDHYPAMPNEGPAITIVATSRSGGAFNFPATTSQRHRLCRSLLGTVVILDYPVESRRTPDAETLVGPRGYVQDCPPGSPRQGRHQMPTQHSGELQNLQVLEPGPAMMSSKVMAALPRWKFRPAMRRHAPGRN